MRDLALASLTHSATLWRLAFGMNTWAVNNSTNCSSSHLDHTTNAEISEIKSDVYLILFETDTAYTNRGYQNQHIQTVDEKESNTVEPHN